ncbi:hypothetical protein BJ165DRAFT_1410185 [Panaeolus papilionaceus]|nr:hypothetical protein BJ165DRAFT_1410185 [Panaeolus papilionaceus]
MDGAHSYCFVTGSHYLASVSHFRDCVIDCLGYRTSPGIEGDLEDCPLLQEIMDGLLYTECDVDATTKYVMLCGYERDTKGRVKLLAQSEAQRPAKLTRDTITAVFNVVPGDEDELGDYNNEDPGEGDDGEYSIFGSAMIITHRSYLILRHAFPRLEPHILFRLNLSIEKSRDIDYSPLNEFQERFVFWPAVCEGKCYTREQARQMWEEILLDSNKTSEENLSEAWRGAGNMWVLVSPDRDLAALMNTCKSMRVVLHYSSHLNVHRYIKLNEPWFLPARPFEFPHGHREVDYWVLEWAKRGYEGSNLDAQIPWLNYRRECSHSLSMWNRIRIWRIAKQLDSLADILGYYEVGDVFLDQLRKPTMEEFEYLEMTRDFSVDPLFESVKYLVMGPTGAGKSSALRPCLKFIEAVAGQSKSLSISSNQLAGFTQSVTRYRLDDVAFQLWDNKYPIDLIDTPGFADSKISEMEIIQMVRTWLKDNGIEFVQGVLYMTPINETRLPGTKRRTIEMLKALLAPSNELRTIIFVTTMWDTLHNEQTRLRGESNFVQLKDEILKEFVANKAKVACFTNTRLSGLKTLDSIYSGSRTLSDSDAFRSPFLYQDLYARIENTLQEKRSILFDLSQPDVMTNDELRTILEKRLNETNETLSKFIRQFVEFGDPPAEFEAAAQSIFYRLLYAGV